MLVTRQILKVPFVSFAGTIVFLADTALATQVPLPKRDDPIVLAITIARAMLKQPDGISGYRFASSAVAVRLCVFKPALL